MPVKASRGTHWGTQGRFHAGGEMVTSRLPSDFQLVWHTQDPGKPGGLVLWPLELPRRQWRRWWLRKKGEAEIAAKKKEVENEIASRMKESEVMRNVYNGFYGLLFDCFTWECTERHVGHELSIATVPGQKYTTELPVCKQWSDQLLPPAMDLPTSTNYIFLFCHAMPILNLWHDSGNHQY